MNVLEALANLIEWAERADRQIWQEWDGRDYEEADEIANARAALEAEKRADAAEEARNNEAFVKAMGEGLLETANAFVPASFLSGALNSWLAPTKLRDAYVQGCVDTANALMKALDEAEERADA